MRNKLMIPKWLVLVACLAMMAGVTAGVEASVTGTVYDTSSNMPIGGAVVRLNTGQAAVTAADGTYEISGTVAGTDYFAVCSSGAYYDECQSLYAIGDDVLDFFLNPVVHPEPGVARDSFARPDSTELGTTEDTNYYPWLAGAEQAADPVQQIISQELVLPFQSAPYDYAGGASITGFLPTDFDMTFAVRWLRNVPAPPHEWGMFAVNYRGRMPSRYWPGNNSDINGGYALVITPDPLNPYGVILKKPSGSNIVLLLKSESGTDTIDWTQSQQVRLKVSANRHQCWINGNPVYDVTDPDNLGGGYITLSHYLGGAAFDNINIARSGYVGTISGVVYREGNPAVVAAGVTVTLDSGQSTTTDAQGRYAFALLGPGTYTVTAGASGYYDGVVSGVIVNQDTTTVDITLNALPVEYHLFDTFSREDATNLGTTEDPNHYRWLAYAEQGSAEQILGGELYLPVQATYDSKGASIGDYLPLDFDMTVDVRAELAGQEWESFSLCYRNSVPHVDLAGGYRLVFEPNPANGWGIIFKNPAGTNIVLLTKAEIGLTNLTVPHTFRVRAEGNRHRCWIDGLLKYDVIDSGNTGGGYITFAHEQSGVYIDNLNINGLKFGLAIQGTVYDSAHPETKLANAAVFLNTGLATTSDENGKFVFRGLEAGTYTVTATTKGYKPGVISGVLLDETQSLVTADMPLVALLTQNHVIDTFARADGSDLGTTEDVNHYPWIPGNEGSDPAEQILAQKLVLPIQAAPSGVGSGVGPAIGGGFLPAGIDMSWDMTIEDGGGVDRNSQVGVAYGLSTNIVDESGYGLGIAAGSTGAYWYFFAPDANDWAVPGVGLRNQVHGSMPSVDWTVPHTVRVVALDTQHMAWLDGELLYSLPASRPLAGGYVSFWHLIDGAQIDNVDVSASGYRVAISGKVQKAGDPSVGIPGATVSLSTGESTVTQSDGSYSFGVTAGTYAVTASAQGYSDNTITNVVVTNSDVTVNVDLTAIPDKVSVFDTFTRPDSTDLGTTEDGGHYPWLRGVEQVADPLQQIISGRLVLPPQSDPYGPISGASIGGFLPADMDMTFSMAWVPNPAPPHDWEMIAVNYRGQQPNAYWPGDNWAVNGGYALVVFANPNNPYELVLKNPVGTNIVLLSKSLGVDWTLPQQVRVRAVGNRHQCWVNGRPVYDVTDTTNVGPGYITWTHFIAGTSIDDINIASNRVAQSSSIGAIKSLADGTTVVTSGSVTAIFADAAYVEALDRSSGIRVEPASLFTGLLGKEVNLAGTMGTSGLERMITVSSVTAGATNVLSPLGTVNKSLSPEGGLAATGLLVTAWGSVTHVVSAGGGESYLYVDDGTGALSDIAGVTGVKVGPVATSAQTGDYVRATGIAGANNSGGVTVRTVRPVSASDVTTIGS